MAVRMFIHGLESSPQGTKSIYFLENFPDMMVPHFTGSLEERMEKLNSLLREKSGIRLVGSSYGGLMASIFALQSEDQVERIVLLAPAINLDEFTPFATKKITTPVWLYHGTDDQVIPFDQVVPVAKKVFANLSLNLVQDDHFLHKTFRDIDWERLLW